MANSVDNADTGKGDEESVASAEAQIVDQVVLWEENALVRKKVAIDDNNQPGIGRVRSLGM